MVVNSLPSSEWDVQPYKLLDSLLAAVTQRQNYLMLIQQYYYTIANVQVLSDWALIMSTLWLHQHLAKRIANPQKKSGDLQNVCY